MIITAVPTPVLKDAQGNKIDSSSISHTAALASERAGWQSADEVLLFSCLAFLRWQKAALWLRMGLH